MLFWGNDSLQFVIVSLEEVTFIASGKCPMLLLSLVCAITGWLKHSPLLWIRVEKNTLFLFWVSVPVWVLCMAKQGHVHHRSRRWLWTQSLDAYGNMTVTGNVQHVSLCCNWARGEGVLERSPPWTEGCCWCWLHDRLGAVQNLPLSGSETSENTLASMLRCSWTNCMSGHGD